MKIFWKNYLQDKHTREGKSSEKLLVRPLDMHSELSTRSLDGTTGKYSLYKHRFKLLRKVVEGDDVRLFTTNSAAGVQPLEENM